jgi:hypothetical protein
MKNHWELDFYSYGNLPEIATRGAIDREEGSVYSVLPEFLVDHFATQTERLDLLKLFET